MSMRSRWRISAVLLLLQALSAPQARGAETELWRSSLHELVEVTIEKKAEQAALQKLPDEIVEQAGKNLILIIPHRFIYCFCISDPRRQLMSLGRLLYWQFGCHSNLSSTAFYP
jgi:hypothetical protein